VFLCFSRVPEDSTLVPKHVGVDTMNCILLHLLVTILTVMNTFIGVAVDICVSPPLIYKFWYMYVCVCVCLYMQT
jgi:hypothetical protein